MPAFMAVELSPVVAGANATAEPAIIAKTAVAKEFMVKIIEIYCKMNSGYQHSADDRTNALTYVETWHWSLRFQLYKSFANARKKRGRACSAFAI
jgi:hypothetical protein